MDVRPIPGSACHQKAARPTGHRLRKILAVPIPHHPGGCTFVIGLVVPESSPYISPTCCWHPKSGTSMLMFCAVSPSCQALFFGLRFLWPSPRVQKRFLRIDHHRLPVALGVKGTSACGPGRLRPIPCGALSPRPEGGQATLRCNSCGP